MYFFIVFASYNIWEKKINLLCHRAVSCIKDASQAAKL